MSIPRSSSRPSRVAAASTTSILLVLTSKPWETWYVVRVSCLLIRFTTSSLWTTCGTIASAGIPEAAQEGDDHAALPTQPLRRHHRLRRAAVDAQRPLHAVRADRLARGAGDDERVPRVARVVDRRRDQVADPDRRDRQREQAEEELGDRGGDAVAGHGGTIARAGSGAVQARFRPRRPRRSAAGRGP